jgi:hypothetical protein
MSDDPKAKVESFLIKWHLQKYSYDIIIQVQKLEDYVWDIILI